MTRRALAGFVLINIFVSIVVAVGIILIFNETSSNEPTIVTREVPVMVENTTNSSTTVPGQLPNDAFARTITALTQTIGALDNENEALGDLLATAGIEQATATPRTSSSDSGGAPTIPPEVLGGVTLPPEVNTGGSSTQNPDAGTSAVSVPDDGCQRYFVQAGDNCGLIVEQFEITYQDLLGINPEINANCTNLRIDQELLIPSDSCAPPPTPTLTPSPTSTPFPIGTFSITNTPIPTAINAEVEITQVLAFGDVSNEQVDIRNTGSGVVNLSGWTLQDDDGNVYTFGDIRLQPAAILSVLTRFGQDTPRGLYWNQTVSVWEEGDVATLLDANDDLQSTYVVQSETIDFDN